MCDTVEVSAPRNVLLENSNLHDLIEVGLKVMLFS